MQTLNECSFFHLPRHLLLLVRTSLLSVDKDNTNAIGETALHASPSISPIWGHDVHQELHHASEPRGDELLSWNSSTLESWSARETATLWCLSSVFLFSYSLQQFVLGTYVRLVTPCPSDVQLFRVHRNQRIIN